MLKHVSVLHALLLSNNTPLCGYITFYLSFGHFSCSNTSAFKIITTTNMYTFLCEHVFLVLFGIYLGRIAGL